MEGGPRLAGGGKAGFMCGRYTDKLDEKQLWQLIEDTLVPALPEESVEQMDLFVHREHAKRYNIVPTNHVPIIFSDPVPQMDFAHWWLLPEWAGANVKWRRSGSGTKSFSWIGPPKSHFNSKYATLTDRKNRYWSGLLAHKRCLFPADGFIEWPDKAMAKPGQPHNPRYFFLKNQEGKGGQGSQRGFFFPGVYDIARDDEGKRFLSANLITVEPNELVAALPHHRMPAILADADAALWLSRDLDFEGAKSLLRTLPAEAMDAYDIGTLANKAANDSPEVLVPVEPG